MGHAELRIESPYFAVRTLEFDEITIRIILFFRLACTYTSPFVC